MTKLDLKKDLKHLYNPPSKQVVEVVVPPMQFIQIDGAGDPNDSPTFQAATETLYGLSYSLKFTSKKTLGIDYGVMPLEGLWWLDEGIFDLDIDLSLEYEGKDNVYFGRKVLIGSGRCFQQIEVEAKFTSARDLIEKEVKGGTFVE